MAKPTLRQVALAIGVLAALVLSVIVFIRLFDGSLAAPLDFTAFWTAGKIGAEGGNAYDAARVHELQRGLGLDDTAIMMWNPPWTLTLVMPLGLLPFRTAYGFWVLLHIGLMIASAELLWRGLGGPKHSRGLAYLLTLAFVPTIFLIGSGQLTAVVLVGLAGFIALREKHPFLAGAAGAFTAVKPHLLVLFALWLVFEAIVVRSLRDRTRPAPEGDESVRSRSDRTTPIRPARRVLLGGFVVGLLACLPPTLAHPGIWGEYVSATTGASSADHEHLSRWTPPLAGWWLRAAVPGHPFWVQWIPLVLGVALFSRWYFKRKETPSIPALVGLSLLIAPYGVWQHDLVMLLVPILAVAVKLAARPTRVAMAVGIFAFSAANGAMFAMMVAHTSSERYVWVVPAVLLGCFATARIADREATPAPAPRPLGA